MLTSPGDFYIGPNLKATGLVTNRLPTQFYRYSIALYAYPKDTLNRT